MADFRRQRQRDKIEGLKALRFAFRVSASKELKGNMHNYPKNDLEGGEICSRWKKS